jgi:hypothetical protein
VVRATAAERGAHEIRAQSAIPEYIRIYVRADVMNSGEIQRGQSNLREFN